MISEYTQDELLPLSGIQHFLLQTSEVLKISEVFAE
jgi:hypothetical protein